MVLIENQIKTREDEIDNCISLLEDNRPGDVGIVIDALRGIAAHYRAEREERDG